VRLAGHYEPMFGRGGTAGLKTRPSGSADPDVLHLVLAISELERDGRGAELIEKIRVVQIGRIEVGHDREVI
jgi:hypothetical protein